MKIEELKSSQNITIFCNSKPNIGYFSRTFTRGKEFDMVVKYINYLIDSNSKLKQKKLAIFIEPQIGSGYPDLVIVEYYSLPKLFWEKERYLLNSTDLKILFYIQSKKELEINDICVKLGFSFEEAFKSIKKLNQCSLIRLCKNNNLIKCIKLSNYCRIKKIISIEAKLDKWQDAIRQANNNIWFSTESYILMNKESCSNSIKTTCKNDGIGIILCNGKVSKELTSIKRIIPVSYASLQFNEWLLRYINQGDI